MHGFIGLVNFLLLLVVLTISLLHLPYQVISHKSFSIDLIRRKSSTTTLQGGGQKKHPLGSISNHHRIRLSSTLYNTNKVQTVVIPVPDGGVYVMKISIGSPPVEFTVVADTGSDLMWVQCISCQGCQANQTPRFDPTKSSTNKRVACTYPLCDAHRLGLPATLCIRRDNSCTYMLGYADNKSQSNGILSTDTITFSSPQTSFPGLFFGCGNNQYGDFHADGIIGLGGGPSSLITQLGPNINYKFSYCLTPLSSGVHSKLNFGHDVTGPGVVSTPINNRQNIPIPPTFYYLALDSITIGTTSIPVSKNLVIDSGTTLTFLPSSVYDAVRTTMKGAIGLTPVVDPAKLYDLCYDTSSTRQEGFNPPDAVFNFDGADVVLKAENTFWESYGLTCLAMIPVVDDDFIFGNIAQVNYHVGYDLKANQVSFAKADCSNF